MQDRTIYSTNQFQDLIDEEFNKILERTPWAEEFAVDTNAYYAVQDSMIPFAGDQVPRGEGGVYAAIGSLEALRDINERYRVIGLYVHEIDLEDMSEVVRMINSMNHIEDLYLRLRDDDMGIYEDLSISGLKRYRSREILCLTPKFALRGSSDTLTHFRWDPSDLSKLSMCASQDRIFDNGEVCRLREVKYVNIPSSVFTIEEYGDKIEYLNISTHSDQQDSRRQSVCSSPFPEYWSKKLQRLTTVYTGWITRIALIRLLSYPNMVEIHANLLDVISLPVRTPVSPIRSLSIYFSYVSPSPTTPYFSIPYSLYDSLEHLSLEVESQSDGEVIEEYVLSRIRFDRFKVLDHVDIPELSR